MGNNSDSPAVELYKLAMREQGHQMGRCRLRVEHCAQDAVALCVRYGIQFFVDDFIENNMPAGEGFYAIACGREREHHNKSAVLAMEKKWGRKPFILRHPCNKTGTRVYVGKSFDWLDNLTVYCTSFNDAEGYFTACAYEDWQQRKVTRRFRITHDDIRGYHKFLDARHEFSVELAKIKDHKPLMRVRERINSVKPTKKQSSDWMALAGLYVEHTAFVTELTKEGGA